MHPGGMGCTERAITLLDWSCWESGFEVALGVPVLTLFSVSSAVRGRGQRTAETPSNPKVTQLGKSHQWGGNHPDAEITPHGLPGRARMSRHGWGIIGLIWKRQGGFSDCPPCFPPHPTPTPQYVSLAANGQEPGEGAGTAQAGTSHP